MMGIDRLHAIGMKDDHRALARSVGLTMQGSIDNAIRNFLTK